MTFEKASVLCYRIYDVADEIDLEHANRLLSEDTRRLKLTREGSQYLELPNPPLTVLLGKKTLKLRSESLQVETWARVFDHGAASIVLEVPIAPGATFERVTVLADELYDSDAVEQLASRADRRGAPRARPRERGPAPVGPERELHGDLRRAALGPPEREPDPRAGGPRAAAARRGRRPRALRPGEARRHPARVLVHRGRPRRRRLELRVRLRAVGVEGHPGHPRDLQRPAARAALLRRPARRAHRRASTTRCSGRSSATGSASSAARTASSSAAPWGR